MCALAGALWKQKPTSGATRPATRFVGRRRVIVHFLWSAGTRTFILFTATISCSTFPGSAKESEKEFSCAGWSRSKESSGWNSIAQRNLREEDAPKDREKLQA